MKGVLIKVDEKVRERYTRTLFWSKLEFIATKDKKEEEKVHEEGGDGIIGYERNERKEGDENNGTH